MDGIGHDLNKCLLFRKVDEASATDWTQFSSLGSQSALIFNTVGSNAVVAGFDRDLNTAQQLLVGGDSFAGTTLKRL